MGQVSAKPKSVERSTLRFILREITPKIWFLHERDGLCEGIFASGKQAIDFAASKKTRDGVTVSICVEKPSSLRATRRKSRTADENPRALDTGVFSHISMPGDLKEKRLIDPETGDEILPLSTAEYRRHLAFAGFYYACFAVAVCGAFYYH